MTPVYTYTGLLLELITRAFTTPSASFSFHFTLLYPRRRFHSELLTCSQRWDLFFLVTNEKTTIKPVNILCNPFKAITVPSLRLV